MRRCIYIELPPIPEVWKEASIFYTRRYVQPYAPVREQNLADLVREVRYIISLEEVYGPGLLDRFESGRN